MNKVLLQRRDAAAVTPYRHYPNDAGYDLVCCESAIIWPFTCKDVDTGWNIKVPDDAWGTIKTRSSTFTRRNLLVLEGVIDPNYTGKLSVVVFNPTLFPKIIKRGDRLAQLMLIPKVNIKFEGVIVMPVTCRGSRGFGSSGGM